MPLSGLAPGHLENAKKELKLALAVYTQEHTKDAALKQKAKDAVKKVEDTIDKAKATFKKLETIIKADKNPNPPKEIVEFGAAVLAAIKEFDGVDSAAGSASSAAAPAAAQA